MTNQTDKTPGSYKEAISEIEEILLKMEANQCDIDSLAAYTARALELLKFCKERLFKTDKEVEKCLQALNDTLSE
jgi:exodeoxyribonuclease VII small subunit